MKIGCLYFGHFHEIEILAKICLRKPIPRPPYLRQRIFRSLFPHQNFKISRFPLTKILVNSGEFS